MSVKIKGEHHISSNIGVHKCYTIKHSDTIFPLLHCPKYHQGQESACLRIWCMDTHLGQLVKKKFFFKGLTSNGQV